VVLAFGGYGGSKEGLLPVAREFHGWGAEVWLVDFRGCGGSEGDVTSIGFHEADDVAAAVREAVGQGSRPVVIYGTSMGAAAILHAVHRRQVQPAALVLECPFDRLLSTVENRFRLMGLPPFPLAHLLVFWGGAQQGFNGFAHNPVAYAASVSCPTLLLQGDRDTRVRLAEANAIAANLGSSGQQVVFAGLSHESYLAAQPDRWRTEVGGFLSRVVAAFLAERPRETPPSSE
jgi:alpha-beta hydrolase superfamily lysophospholipase